MCDDSRAERRYWVQRVEALQKEMEQEDRERQRAQAKPSARPATVEPTALPSRMPAMAAVAREAWTIGSVVAGIVVALSILLFSMPGAAATFVYVSPTGWRSSPSIELATPSLPVETEARFCGTALRLGAAKQLES